LTIPMRVTRVIKKRTIRQFVEPNRESPRQRVKQNETAFRSFPFALIVVILDRQDQASSCVELIGIERFKLCPTGWQKTIFNKVRLHLAYARFQINYDLRRISVRNDRFKFIIAERLAPLPSPLSPPSVPRSAELRDNQIASVASLALIEN